MTLSLKATSETNAHTQSRLVTNVRFQLQLQLQFQLSDSNSNLGRFVCACVGHAVPCRVVHVRRDSERSDNFNWAGYVCQTVVSWSGVDVGNISPRTVSIF